MGQLRQVVRGTPKEFDAMLRPAARMAQLAVALPVTAVLVCMGQWWWLPVPLALSFVLYELVFWFRGDRPITLTRDGTRLHLEDRYVDQRRSIDLAQVHTATTVYRRLEADEIEVVALLTSRDQVLLALSMRVTEGRFQARPGDVDLDLVNGVLGSISGVVRALAPREVLVRQSFADDAPLEWLRDTLPGDVWSRTAVRCWRGAAPELDLFGYHSTPADGWIELQGDRVAYDGGPAQVLESVAEPRVAERRAVLFRMAGEEHMEAAERLPLWVHRLGNRDLAFPAPISDGQGPRCPLEDHLHHTHPPEAAVILWHLWTHLPRERWPSAWSEALDAARANLPESATLPAFVTGLR